MSLLHHLRHIVANIESQSPPSTTLNSDWLNNLPFVKAKISVTGHIIGIRKEAGEALHSLAGTIFDSSDEYRRGATFQEILDETINALLIEFVGRNAESISDSDLVIVKDKIAFWFAEKASLYHLYIPCILSTYFGASFMVGPVSFSYIDNFVTEERESIKSFDFPFKRLLNSMHAEGALWMATVDVSRCLTKRAWELGDLAIDIALVGLQLVIPLHFSERISRLTSRTLPRYRETVCLINGCVNGGGINQHPALGMGSGCIELYVNNGAAILLSAGHRVNGFLNANNTFPKLEQAWCDSAYWFHEGLAEPLDTIAVAKLETAIEVLLRTEKTAGSKTRLVLAIKTFYGLNHDQFINLDSKVTVDQFAKDFVRDRSRILHGTWSTLSTNLRDSRPSLTLLVQGLLKNYTLELDAFMSDATATDDTEKFLNWVSVRRQPLSNTAGTT